MVNHSHHHHHETTNTLPIEVLTDNILKEFKLNMLESTDTHAHNDIASSVESHASMLFHFGYKETILFEFWQTNSVLCKYNYIFNVLFTITSDFYFN